MNEAELKGLILLLLPAGGYALSLYRHGELLVRVLRWAIGFVQRQDKLQEAKPPTNNGNGNGNAAAIQRQLYDSLMLTQESEANRVTRLENAFDEFRKAIDDKLNQQGLLTRAMFDSVLLNVNNMKRAMDERLTRQDGQIAELLVIARNGNGKHPPETSGEGS